MSDEIVNVSDRDFEHEVLESELPVLVDFWAGWCGPCHIVAPVVEEIAAAEAGRLRVAKLDIDDNPRTAQRFGVMSIPTLILFVRGEERGRVIGARGKDHIVQTLLGDLAA
jgi:thioredoxin 1